ncbi:Aurofusarin cluster transcription factor [Lachnellula subtilissima]|uniref:Aurofusarin cluster transcription factor n=1 Tax=Lachnellula subtilissima TaxID=602034 RepID=A0A8H8RRU7_9HELO|nr:Aurofusarin cluster transcription factor [Lachnellula subtilissima]
MDGQTPLTKITRGHSCLLCQQRKVKCDRQKPCSNCIKAQAQCVASTPSLPRRRKRKLTEIDLAAKLRKYEHLLKSHGVNIDEDIPEEFETDEPLPQNKSPDHHEFQLLSMNAPSPRTSERDGGSLYTNKGNSHYVDNPFWQGIHKDDFQYPKDALQAGSSDDESNDGAPYPHAESLLVGHTSTGSKKLTCMHPQPVHIFRLWQTFLVHVNPLVKIFHAPTVQQMILDASGNLETVSRSTEALMFSIYFLAVVALDNADCQSMFNETRQVLLAKYCNGTQQALINAKFLKSLNISTLHAFIIYLHGVRKNLDHHSMSVLTGVAVRIAQRLGLHRDSSKYKVSPFDAEIRRRTWWQVVFLDGHASKLAGFGFQVWNFAFDTQVPLNISDSDLSPTMKEPPKEKEGATEMMFCCLRFDVAVAIRRAGTTTGSSVDDGEIGWTKPHGPQHLQAKDKAINDLEAHFERKYTRYCDASIPLHLLVMHVAKSVICTMRIMAHHPRQYPDKGASMPQAEKDFVFREGLKELEIDGLGQNSKELEGFRWHIQHYFQLSAFIYILSELRHRLTGDLVERSWQQVETAYEYRPHMITDTKNALYYAIGNLTLKAWRRREESGVLSHRRHGNSTPRYITLLRAQRNVLDLPQPAAVFQNQESYLRSNQMPDYTSNLPPTNNRHQITKDEWEISDLSYDNTMPEITPVDWEYWNTLMDGELPAYTGNGYEMEYNWSE